MDSFIGFYHRWLLIFFQEDSHPTIGKVCENESQKNSTEWFTFQKARLKCTSQDGVIYSSLVAVKNLPYNTTLYLTLMSSSVDNKNQSALCLFTYLEIARVFNSNTYYDPDYSNEWRAVPSDSIPYGRYSIGVCSWRSTWTDQQKKFIRSHPLMYNNVTASQVLAERDALFTALESIQKKGRDEKRHIMVFVGTDDGRILKYALIDQDTALNFLEEIYFTQDSSVGITNLEIVGSPSELKIWTTDAAEPLKEPLQRCGDMEIQCVCEQDPYCTWNDDGSCRSFEWNSNSIAQPRITNKTCEGIAPGSALLVTNRHGRPINDPSATTVDTETTVAKLGPAIGPGLEEETAQSAPAGPWTVTLFLTCSFVLLIILVVILFLLHIMYWKKSPTNQDFALDHRDWTSDWTSITFNQKVPYLKLKDTTEGGTEYTGKVVKKKTVFEDLPPLTNYEVIHNSDRSPFLVSTKGPSFSDWGTTVDTVEVRTAGCQAQYESHLVLKYDGGISPRMNIEESVMFSGLIPNMKYVVWLEVCKKDSEKVIEKCITDVTTKEESFRVEMVDGKPCLMWSDLSSGIERYIQSCSCGEFQNFLTDINSLVSGSKELPPQPQHAKFNLKVMTKIPVTDGGELEHILAYLEYETSPLALVKLPEQSSLLQSSLPEDSSGLVMTTTQDTLDGDDSSFRLHSLPVSEGDSEGLYDDSSSRIRSEPPLGSDFKEVARQMSEGNKKVTFILADRTTVILGSEVNVNNGSSISSGIGSLQSSQSSFVDLPFKGYGLQIGKGMIGHLETSDHNMFYIQLAYYFSPSYLYLH
ncbi:Semaphorin-4A [Holothuria leucospilota]|uniref:Semaphorin-4A n=1 Tax=Holothuria leucospilota TaxID=206669 RepID=A0A9Q1C381_HOLLE|nr:Semaphorin-4A [Holothuria leucospilota]